jgi:hypothetical protein
MPLAAVPPARRQLLRVPMRGHGCRSSTPAAAGAPYVDAAELAGKLMPPAVLALVNVSRPRSDSRGCRPQRARTLALSPIFPANQHLLRVPKWVAMGADHGPRGAAGPHRLPAELAAKAMPPLWQYFSRLLKRQTSPSLPQRGRITDPKPFPCKRAAFRGPRRGPRSRSRTPLAGTPPRHARRDGGRRPCPRCGSTSRGCERGR